MNNQEVKNSIAEKVLNKIKSGQINMKPKAYFVLKTVLFVLGVITVALFILYLISFIAFSLRASGVMFLPGFGFRGVGIFLTSMPWLLILVAVLLIVVLEILVKHFAFSYRRPILYSIIAIIVLVFLGSFIINKTQFHPDLFQRAREGRLPLAGEFYRDFGVPKFQNVHRGVVSEVIDNGFRIETPNKEILEVIVDSETRFPFGTGIKESDTVVVLGERNNGTVQASGVSKIDDNFKIFKQDRPSKPRNMLIPHRMPIMPDR